MKQLSSSGKKILLLLSIALILRILFVFFLHPPEDYLYSDMKRYYNGAVKIAHSQPEDLFDSFHPPGTQYLYALFFRLPHSFFWIKVFNVLISTSSCYLIFLSTKLLFNEKAAWIAFAITSLNYLFIDFTGYLLSTTPFIFCLTLMFYSLIKSIKSEYQNQRRLYSFLTGLFVTVSISFNPTFLLFVPFFGLWWLFNFKKYHLASNVPFYFLGFLPLYFLLCFRVYLLTGQLGTIASNGGLNFYVGRAHVFFVHLHDVERNRKFDFASPVATQKNYAYSPHFKKGPYDSAFFFKEGLKEIRKDIPRTVSYSLEYLNNLFCSTVIWPSAAQKGFSGVIKYFNIAFVFTIIVPAIALFFVRFKSITGSLQLLACLPIFVIIATAITFHAEPRYRVPYDVFFIILAGYFYSTVNWLKIKESLYGLYRSIRK